jgi:hypothetical protein
MQPIVDFRLGDVYRVRWSSHLIYAGSRHDPGLRLIRSHVQHALESFGDLLVDPRDEVAVCVDRDKCADQLSRVTLWVSVGLS